MGDRGNIITKSGDEQICFYTHGCGYDLPEVLRDALTRGRDRWTDFQYLNRIIFCSMIKGRDIESLTGYGITQNIYDDDYGGAIIVDVDSQTVEIPNTDAISFSEYIKMKRKWNIS